MAKRSRVEEFLASAKPPKSGGKCRTCSHPKRGAIEEDSIEFNARRKEGATVGWAYFVDAHLKAEHGYTHNFRSLVAHLEKCLGLEVH